ncbi:hypothetical protein ZWY2020_034652 [Hordeum vulgare]|nr:hypothetical protein ZWY2020_034652 [Hordeum vulgare]
MGSRLDARTLKDEVASMDRRPLLDLGHPLLNRVADSFIRAAGSGRRNSVAGGILRHRRRDGRRLDGLDTSAKRSNFSSARGDDGQKSLDAVVKSAGKEAIQWGLAAGVYSGITYGLREARGHHDWKNSAIAGAIAGAAVALTGDNGHSDHVVHFAITGAALSSAATMLSGIF